jgi:PKD repeat protein
MIYHSSKQKEIIMSKKIRVFWALVLILILSNFSWASCPEEPSDLGICDTLYVAPWPYTDTCFISGADTICINVPGQKFPCFWYVHLLVTHDLNNYKDISNLVQDSLAGFVVPLTWTRTNPSKYCSLLAYWNTSDYSGAGLTRSVFRDHGGMQNRMLDLQWYYHVVQDSTTPPYFRMSLIRIMEQCWWESNKTLLATLTFKLQDTMTVAFDSTFWPPSSRLAFSRKDGVSYIPRLIQTEVPPDTILTADFSAVPRSVAVACTVRFTDLSTGNPTSWFWNFGDNSTSTDTNPTHAYNDTGYFDVKLVVSNASQTDSIIKHDYIHVFTPGHIAGYVRNTLGQPIYLAQVKIQELLRTTTTNSSGYYKFTNVEPGSYTLIAKASDYAISETTVTVVAQETTWVNFTLEILFSVSNYPGLGEFNWSLETGDFNGDNNVDIIVQSFMSPDTGITILWGHGDGTFTPQAQIPNYGLVLVKGYFNSDDFLDFAVDNYNRLAIMLNDGHGNFTPRYFDLHGSAPLSIAKGYLNSDANLDLITANMNEHNLSIFRGVGNGDFVFVKNLNISTQSVDVGDFNEDGKADLVVGTHDSLTVLLGDGNWNFTRSYAAYFGSIGTISTMNSLADFNRDGNLDVIFALPWATPDTNRIAILLGDGTGGFSSSTILYETGAQLCAVIPGDFNGDNNLDFAAGINPDVKVYFGDGTGNFPQRILNDIGAHALSLSSGDFNEDGNWDIVAGEVGDGVSVLLNLHPPKPAIEDEFVLTGYTSVNLFVTDPYGSSASILANAIAGADYFQKDCNSDSALDDRVYNFNAIPGRYRVGVTPSPGAEPGGPSTLGIRINGSAEVTIPCAMKGSQTAPGDTVFFIITDSLPTLCQPTEAACLCQDTITLFWNKIDGTSQYHFQLDDNSDFSSPAIDDSAVTDTSLYTTSPLSGNTYFWRIRANGGVWSVFSLTRSFFRYSHGDVNLNGNIDLGDVVYLITYQYKNGPAPICLLAGDVNCDGLVDLGDVVYLITFLYKNGPAPPC